MKNLVDINKLRMLRICVYWGTQLEPIDPDVTSTYHVLDWIGKSPQRARSLKKAH